MASLREDIAGSIVREPPPYPRYSIDTVQIDGGVCFAFQNNSRIQARIREVQCFGPLALVRDFQTCFNKYLCTYLCNTDNRWLSIKSNKYDHEQRITELVA